MCVVKRLEEVCAGHDLPRLCVSHLWQLRVGIVCVRICQFLDQGRSFGQMP